MNSEMKISLGVWYLPAAAELCNTNDEFFLQHKHSTWKLPVDRTALVLVDTWDRHYLKSHQERIAKICREKIRPVIEICRNKGIMVIYAPSPVVAKHYLPKKLYEQEMRKESCEKPSIAWPYKEYRKFAKSKNSKQLMLKWQNIKKGIRIPSSIKPEPCDQVIATGQQLRNFCQQKNILHLIYAGFAANWCLLFQDYGVRKQTLAGYNVILLQDCTTAVENDYTISQNIMTTWAILEAETVFRTATTTSKNFIDACKFAR